MRMVAVIGSLVIVVAGGIIAYALQSGGDCPGGAVYRNLEMCLDSVRTPERCNLMMTDANTMLARSGPVSNTREQCEDRYGTCQNSRGAVGFVPRATGFCLMRGPPETIAPVYGSR